MEEQDSKGEESIDFNSIFDESDNQEIKLLKRESGLFEEKYKTGKTEKAFIDYFRVKCEGYDKAIEDMKKTEFLMMFAGYIDLNEEIMFCISTMNIEELESIFIHILKKKITTEKKILELFHNKKKS